MTYAHVLQSGNNQTMRLLKKFRLCVDQVEIIRQGNDIVRRQMPANAAACWAATSASTLSMNTRRRGVH